MLLTNGGGHRYSLNMQQQTKKLLLQRFAENPIEVGDKGQQGAPDPFRQTQQKPPDFPAPGQVPLPQDVNRNIPNNEAGCQATKPPQVT